MSARRRLRVIVWLGVFATSSLAASDTRVAHAQTKRAFDVHAELDTDVVEVGGVVHMTLRAGSTTDELTNAASGALSGFSLAGQNMSPSESISIVNGRMSQKHGLTAVWALKAQKLGSFMLGPPTIEIGGKRVAAAERLTVKVVPKGQGPKQAPAPLPSPFGGLIQLDPRQDDDPPTGRLGADDIQTDPKLALDVARGAGAFLHATVDKTRAVVGEQVTHSIYLYVDLGEREPNFNDVHEPSTPAFLKQPLVGNDGQTKAAGVARVGGRLFAVKLIRRAALFPIKPGELMVGPMKVGVVRNNAAKGSVRESEPLPVHVVEPPLAGRPPGYALGDVGRFALTAEVFPRTTTTGGAVGVIVTLEGTGNLPHELTVPRSADAEWLDPEVRDDTGPKDGERFGGTRTFRYVVRTSKPGPQDLGELRLPFYDAEAKRYQIASAKLGTITTTGSAAAAPSTDSPTAPTSPLARLPKVATKREPRADGRASYLTDSWLYPVLFAIGPLGFGLLLGGTTLLRHVHSRRRAHAARPDTELAARRKEAKAAAEASNGIGAVERYLSTLVRLRTGIDPRGVTRDALRGELSRAGLPETEVASVMSLAQALEDARFAPDGGREGHALLAEVERLESGLTDLRPHEQGADDEELETDDEEGAP